ncbi:MAG: hypothetical protein ACFFD8_00155 [Candidatus Thorarchaeota archaeon]
MSDLWWPRFIRKPRLRLRRPQLGEIRMPSKWIFFGIALVVYYFIVSGGMFTLSYQPQPLIPMGEGQPPLALYPGIHRQLLIEGIVGGALYFVGFLGFFLMYQSTRNIYRPRYSQMLLAAGLVLILVSFFGCQWLINEKFRLASELG